MEDYNKSVSGTSMRTPPNFPIFFLFQIIRIRDTKGAPFLKDKYDTPSGSKYKPYSFF
jgi:hypothetical protein